MRLARLTLFLLAAATALLGPSRAWSARSAPSEGTVTITAEDGSVSVTSDDDNAAIRSDDGTVTITPSTGISTITSSDGKVTITTEDGEPEAPTEIVLGVPPAPAPPTPPARVGAVTRYLAARQAGSFARSQGRMAKLVAMAPSGATAEELYGAKGSRLLAFDFQEDAIEPLPAGGFQVAAYLLFADESGQVVESRDEWLTFRASPMGYTCASRNTTSSMDWSSDSVLDRAAALGESDSIQEASARLREWSGSHDVSRGYSLSEVSKAKDGRVIVRCLRFKASPGQRGYDVVTEPLILSRERGVLHIDSN